jgi:hypothetical protein
MTDDVLRLIGNIEMDVNKRPERHELIDKLMGEILDVENKLNGWERDFIHDMTLRFAREDYDISERQFDSIKKIHARRVA